MKFFAFLLTFFTITASADEVAKVLLFVTPDCPIVNSYAPEFTRLKEEYSPKKVAFQLVYPEASLTEERVKEHLKEYGLDLRYVIDREHSLVEKAHATTTPEAAVFNSNGELVYRGRIDNLYSDYGDRRRTATKQYLRDVIDKLLAGETIAFSETEPIGCLIEPLAD